MIKKQIQVEGRSGLIYTKENPKNATVTYWGKKEQSPTRAYLVSDYAGPYTFKFANTDQILDDTLELKVGVGSNLLSFSDTIEKNIGNQSISIINYPYYLSMEPLPPFTSLPSTDEYPFIKFGEPEVMKPFFDEFCENGLKHLKNIEAQL